VSGDYRPRRPMPRPGSGEAGHPAHMRRGIAPTVGGQVSSIMGATTWVGTHACSRSCFELYPAARSISWVTHLLWCVCVCGVPEYAPTIQEYGGLAATRASTYHASRYFIPRACGPSCASNSLCLLHRVRTLFARTICDEVNNLSVPLGFRLRQRRVAVGVHQILVCACS